MDIIEKLSATAYDQWMSDSPDFPNYEDVSEAVIQAIKKNDVELFQAVLNATLDKLDATTS